MVFTTAPPSPACLSACCAPPHPPAFPPSTSRPCAAQGTGLSFFAVALVALDLRSRNDATFFRRAILASRNTSLTGAHLKFAVAKPQPTDTPEAAREALVESTRSQHMNYLKRVAKEINPDQPLDRALVSTLQTLAARHNWRHSTQLKAAASAQGAFKILPPLREHGEHPAPGFPDLEVIPRDLRPALEQELPAQPKAATCEPYDE